MLPPKRALIAAVHDSFMAAFSFFVAMFLRLGTQVFSEYTMLWHFTLLFAAIATTVFISMGLYRGIWRYASATDLVHITKAATISIFIFMLAAFLINRLDSFPRSVFAIHWLTLIALLGGPRFMYRMLKDKTSFLHFLAPSLPSGKIPVLLIGISETSIHFLRECQSPAKDCPYFVVGIIDEHRKNKGQQIQGVQVYGSPEELPDIVSKLTDKGQKPQRLILGLTQAEGTFVKYLLDSAEAIGLTLAKLPRLTEFKEHTHAIEVRPIAIEDLLGRAPTTPKKDLRRDLIKDKTILVTGAGGTIGSELAHQIASHEPKRLIALDHSEFNIYTIDTSLRQKFPALNLRTVITDIRDHSSIEAIFAGEQPDIVFHAAALKHVPLVESNLTEAVKTNILGVQIIADTCLKYNTHKMVFISTDKAVNPSSLMGVTKRVGERYIQALGTSTKGTGKTQFAIVRFGNVLGSSGSVIPLFQQQLSAGGPITVTHPDMTRFFMTVPEAVELVLRAATIDTGKADKHSNLFVLDMGKPIKIQDLALQMIKLAGLRVGKDITITYTGIRPGEKLFEELFYAHEEAVKTAIESIMEAHGGMEDIAFLTKALYDMALLCKEQKEQLLRQQLLALVPEYISSDPLSITEAA